MPDIIRPLPANITDVIRKTGGRKLVLVEGPDDELAFSEWFGDRLAEVVFTGVSGKPDVQARLSDILAQRPDVDAYGIVDRDLEDDATVQKALSDPATRLFILLRYSIENYALEPDAVYNVLRVYLRTRCPVPDVAATKRELLQLCASLKTLMAANYVIRQVADDLKLFSDSHQIKDRSWFVAETAKRTKLTQGKAETRIAAREAEIDTGLGNMESAHRFISGKHLLWHLLLLANKARRTGEREISATYLFSQLVEHRRANPPVPADLRQIVEKRILQDP